MVLGQAVDMSRSFAPHSGVHSVGGRPLSHAAASSQHAESTSALFAESSSSEQSSLESTHGPKPTPSGATVVEPHAASSDIAESKSSLGKLVHVCILTDQVLI